MPSPGPVALTVERDGRPVTLHTKLADVRGHGGYLGIAATTVFQPAEPARRHQVRRAPASPR